MTIEFFNILWIYFLEKCLIGFKLDTSNLPFSIVAHFIPFYSFNFWIKKNEIETISGKTATRIDILIPFICDIAIFY